MPDGSIRIKTKIDSEESKRDLSNMEKMIERFKSRLQGMSGGSAFKGATADVRKYTRELEKAQKELDKVNQKVAEYEAAFAASIPDGATAEMIDGIYEMYGQSHPELAQLVDQQDKLAKKVSDTKKKLEGANAELEKANKELTKMEGKKGIKKVGDDIASSFKRGLKQVARYALALFSIRGVYRVLSRAANAYLANNEATANKISAAWNTLGEMLAPVIESIVNMFLKAIAYINVFLKALTGIDYVARANARSLNKQAAAQKKLNAQVASFDEMNKLQDETDAGGASGGASAAFETPELNPEFVEKIEWLADQFKDILWYVGEIAAGLLAWKIGSALGLGLKSCIGLFIAAAGFVKMIKEGLDMWQNGINWDNLVGYLKGAALLVGGLALAFGPLGAAIGLIISGVGLLITGFREWIKTGELSTQTLTAIVDGILMVGTAISLLAGGPVLKIVSAIALAVFAIMQFGGTIEQFIDGVKDIFSGLVGFFENLFSGHIIAAIKSLGKSVKGLLNADLAMIGGVINAIIRGLNWLIDQINKIHFNVPDWVPGIGGKSFGFNLPHRREWNVPKLERGGIVNNPRRGVPVIAGEAGREAILPLDKNTEWMDQLAERIGGTIVIPIYLGGKLLTKYEIDAKNRRNFATNGAT